MRLALTVFALTTAALLAACSQPPAAQTPTQQPVAEQPAAADSSSTTGSQESPPAPEIMSLADRRSQIASNFPAEVPVVAGTVVRGKAQGPDAWDYVVETPRDPKLVARWYQQLYLLRNWQLIDDEPYGDDGITFAYSKGTAQSRLTIEPANGGTRVTVVVGVGTPVLQTQ